VTKIVEVANVSLTGVSKDKDTYNKLAMRSKNKLALEYIDEGHGHRHSVLSNLQTNELLRYLYTFVDNITENQARQTIGVLISAGMNIFVRNDKTIELRATTISHSNFIMLCPMAEKNSDITNEKIIYNLFKRAGYDVTDDYKKQSCFNTFDCTACRFAINYLYTIWNISRGYVKEVSTTVTHTCKATRVKHSNMLICECNFKPIYMTNITKYCPYCGGELKINDI
jgi:hypothetical protein